jgi:hypothetical protein
MTEASRKNVVQLSVAYERKVDKRRIRRMEEECRDGIRDLMFEVCRILVSPDHERLTYVRKRERDFGFSVLKNPTAKKKRRRLRLIET